MSPAPVSLSLEQIVHALRRRLPLIVLCTVALAAVAFAFARAQQKSYTTTASIVFENNPLSEQIAGLSANSTNLLVQEASDAQLVRIGDMAAKTAQKLGSGLSEESVRKSLTIKQLGESSAVEVTASARTPSLAAAVANTYAKQFVLEQQNGNDSYFRSALRLVEAQIAQLPAHQRFGPAAVPLQTRAQNLRFLSQSKYGDVKVAQEASIPTSASSPDPARDALIGALLGLLLSAGIALLLERAMRERVIADAGTLEQVYSSRLLGAVPASRSLSAEPAAALEGREQEAYSLIVAHLRAFNARREPSAILLTSAKRGEGVTTVARCMAEAAAQLGSRVLLVEADLREPTLARQLALTPGPGLGEMLEASASEIDVTRSMDNGASSGGRLEAIPGGQSIDASPATLLDGARMHDLLDRSRLTYDLILIDAPSLLSVSDAYPLLARVDGVVVVARVGQAGRREANRLSDTLDASGARLVGLIANGVRAESALAPSTIAAQTRQQSANPSRPGATASEATAAPELISSGQRS